MENIVGKFQSQCVHGCGLDVLPGICEAVREAMLEARKLPLRLTIN